MTEQNRRIEDKRAAGPLSWGEPVRQVRDAAPAKLTDDDITVIWQTMPGGPAGWLKSFGFLQFARAVEDHILDSTAGAELRIGVSDNDQGVHINIMQRHADGTAAVIYTAKAPAGDSYGRASLAAPVAQSTAGAANVLVPRATLLMIYEAMNHMGDILNGMDACEEEDEEATTPAFDAMRKLLDDSYLAAPAAQAPAQVPTEAEAPSQWQPIETAPKDGSEVLLQVKLRAGIEGKQLVGHYMSGGHCIEDHPPIASGWYFWNGCMFDRAAEPTHWMPLPAAPEQSALGEKGGDEA